jgi:DNA-binding FadR family transcriptional regulator
MTLIPAKTQPAPTAHGADPLTALVQDVREYLNRQKYRPGQALPTGIIALRLHAKSKDVARALEILAAKSMVTHREGPYGPAFYVADSESPLQGCDHG